MIWISKEFIEIVLCSGGAVRQRRRSPGFRHVLLAEINTLPVSYGFSSQRTASFSFMVVDMALNTRVKIASAALAIRFESYCFRMMFSTAFLTDHLS